MSKNGHSANALKFLTGDLIRLVETPIEQAKATLSRLGGTEGVANGLSVQLSQGLDANDTADLKLREERYGRNYIEPEKSASLLQLMWQALQDVTIIILCSSGLVSLILGFTIGEDPDTAWIEGASILIAVSIVTLVTALNDYEKDKQFRALNAIKEDEMIKVIRNDRPCEVSKFKLVVGDVVRIELGDILPADGIVFDENDLKMDESSMTGESDLVNKNHVSSPFLFSGTKAMEGMGKMLVTCVGECSQSGIISKLIAGKHVPLEVSSDGGTGDEDASYKEERESAAPPDEDEIVSPLQGKLNRLTLLIGKLGTFTAIIVFVAMSISFSIKTFAIKHEEWKHHYASEYLKFFIVAITVLVVAIPEGLPLAVTISLAFSVKKMLLDNNLVRHLDACETMGSATTICSDKTGTLTTNRMTVMQCFFGNVEFDSSKKLCGKLNDKSKSLFTNAVCLNSTAEILPPLKVGGKPEHSGNKTECALLQYSKDIGDDYAAIRRQHQIARMITFSSAKKRMSVVIPLNDPNSDSVKYQVFTKGASEIVLNLCSQMVELNGNIVSLSPAKKLNLRTSIIDKYASQGLRTLCIAYRDLTPMSEHQMRENSDHSLENNLTLIAIVGIEDPVREEVPNAIKLCKKAGIVVRMVTGDNISTAKSIALKCGIIQPNDNSLIMEGETFRKRVLNLDGTINQTEFNQIWPNLKVLARSSPKDKYTLVSGLINSNLPEYGPQVVAVTGDGTNDAPALKKADVGFAMGICGTAVAKDASDIILMDDNFTSIVNAVKWGRNVYDSISKFLQFQLTVNLVAISVAVVGAIVLEESPLTAVQLLWVNLIMDTFASLALATEAPTSHLLNRKPYPRTKPLLSKKMTKHIIGQAVFQLVILLTVIFLGEHIFQIESGRKHDREQGETAPTTHYTLVFNIFVFLQLFNELNARKIHDELNIFKGILRNKIFIGVTIFQVVAQVLIVQFGGRVFGCKPLNLWEWGVTIGIGALSLPLGLVLRMVHTSQQLLPSQIALYGEIAPGGAPRTRSKDLWMKSFKHVQSNLRVVRAFRSGIKKTAMKLHSNNNNHDTNNIQQADVV